MSSSTSFYFHGIQCSATVLDQGLFLSLGFPHGHPFEHLELPDTCRVRCGRGRMWFYQTVPGNDAKEGNRLIRVLIWQLERIWYATDWTFPTELKEATISSFVPLLKASTIPNKLDCALFFGREAGVREFLDQTPDLRLLFRNPLVLSRIGPEDRNLLFRSVFGEDYDLGKWFYRLARSFPSIALVAHRFFLKPFQATNQESCLVVQDAMAANPHVPDFTNQTQWLIASPFVRKIPRSHRLRIARQNSWSLHSPAVKDIVLGVRPRLRQLLAHSNREDVKFLAQATRYSPYDVFQDADIATLYAMGWKTSEALGWMLPEKLDKYDQSCLAQLVKCVSMRVAARIVKFLM